MIALRVLLDRPRWGEAAPGGHRRFYHGEDAGKDGVNDRTHPAPRLTQRGAFCGRLLRTAWTPWQCGVLNAASAPFEDSSTLLEKIPFLEASDSLKCFDWNAAYKAAAKLA